MGLRVLMLTPDFPPGFGGIQLLSHRLASHLESIDLRVVTLDASAEAREFDAARPIGVHRVEVPAVLGHKGAVAGLNVRALAEAIGHRPDAVLSMHIVAAPASVLVRRLLGVPFVQYVHAKEVESQPSLARLALSRAEAVVVVSRHTRQLAESYGAEREKVHLIHPGVDLPPPAGSALQARDRFTVVTVARLADRHKGHDVMLDVVDVLRPDFPELQWVVIGDGVLRKDYESQATRRGLQHNVTFLGEVDDAVRDAWLERATVFAMPSRLDPTGSEGFGIVLMEAAARGVPVVAGDVGGALDAVAAGRTGYLVDPTDASAVANAIGAFLNDHELAERFGCAGRARAEEFAWPNVAHRVGDVLKEVASSRG